MQCRRELRRLNVLGLVSQTIKWELSYIWAAHLAYWYWPKKVECRGGISSHGRHSEPFSCPRWRLRKRPRSCQPPHLGHGIFYVCQVTFVCGRCFLQSRWRRIWVWCVSGHGKGYLILWKLDVDDVLNFLFNQHTKTIPPLRGAGGVYPKPRQKKCSMVKKKQRNENHILR